LSGWKNKNIIKIGRFYMTAQSYSRGTMNTGILCLTMLLGLAGFANGDSEPNNSAGRFQAIPEDSQSKSQYVICGHITDAKTGQPVTDATVVVEHTYRAETDANGYYHIDTIYNDRDYRIVVDSNGYAGITNYEEMPVVNFRKDKQVVKDFKLDKACIIEVRVVDEANQPVEGAELSVDLPSAEINRRLLRRMLPYKRTGKDGTAIIGGLPPSKTIYRIVATHRTYIQSPQGERTTQLDYAPGKLEVILNDTEIIETGKIVLQKGINVNGLAKYSDGVPALDLKIAAYPNWEASYRTSEYYPIDVNGNFTLNNIIPGNYRLTASIPIGKRNSTLVNITEADLPLADNGLLKLTIPQKSPKSLASIRGKLSFAGGKTPDYVNIDAYSATITSGRSNSTYWQNNRGDACDMNFVIDRLEPGKYRVTVTSTDMERKVFEDVEAPSEGLIVELVPANRPYLKGTVLNSQTGQPIEQYKARIKKIKAFNAQDYMPPGNWSAFDNNEGRFEMKTTGPGIYQVQIAAEGFAWTWSEDVNTDQNVSVVIKPAAGGSIKGSVVDEKGKPVSGAKMIPLSMAGTLSPTGKEIFTSEDGMVEAKNGKFLLNALPPGKETLRVVCEGYVPLIVKDIEVADGQTIEDIKIVLSKGATVEGYVYDSQGKPEAGVPLNISNTLYGVPRASQLAPAVTDSNGYYRVAGLSEETCYIARQDADKALGVITRTVIPRNSDTVRLDFGGKPVVTGTAILNGKPLANQKLILSAADSPGSRAFTCYCLTDNKGGFKLAGPPAGKYGVYYRRPPENEFKMTKLTTFSVEGRDIDLGVIPQQPTYRVLVYADNEANDPKWESARIYLMEGFHNKSPRTTNFADKPAENGQPYIFSNIPAGDYTIVVTRTDALSMQQEIRVEAKETSVSLKMPVSTASISGRITGAQPTIEKQLRMLAIWQKDDKIFGYIQANENGTYKKENLPAGRYSIGGNPRDPNHSLLEVELSEGEQKNIDINASASSIARLAMAYLRVNVVDKSGIPIPGADVVLEGDSGIVKPAGSEYFMASPGNYILRASYPGFKESRQQIIMKLPDGEQFYEQIPTAIVRLEKQ
jgi:protocatechuate 3,4-dioxygenase beta subunit